ncbi:PrgI family protein [candidate division WS5 bacterium]|uniref:PrgI family protein n=1 Tax=candidate division WS5 bacterium TaxID=2093353 RepID=A0A419DGM0_9BACT|nr:MAG: PrgI family protein [candidate division WS5 bacterium]
MAQYKIPQEINVEDKIIGPFTLKGFAFVMVFIIFVIILTVIFTGFGMSFFSALVVGGLMGSPIIIAGFIPFNGKPLYTYTEAFLNFMMKPRQRAWKREVDEKSVAKTKKDTANEHKESANPDSPAENQYIQPKEDIETAEKKIEEIALMVDTGGAYGQQRLPQEDAKDVFSKPSGSIDKDLAEAREKVQNKSINPEPILSDVASVDPNKKFDYSKADTSGYKIKRDNKP